MDDLNASAAAWLRLMRSAPNYFTALNQLRGDLDVNVCAADGVTALHIAAELGAIDKVQYLLEDGADPTLRDVQGRTPRMVAHVFIKTEVVDYLTVHEEFVRELTVQLERTPTAEDVGIAKTFDEFKRFQQKIQQQSQERCTKFVEAARCWDFVVVREMVENKEIHVDDPLPLTGETAFSAALSAGRYRMCKYLLARGAHTYAVCIVDGVVQSTIVAAVRGGDGAFVRLLASQGVSLWTPSQDLETCALAEAAKQSAIPMLELLLEFDARLHAPMNGLGLEASLVFDEAHLVSVDVRSWVILGIACWLENTELIDYLLTTRRVLMDEISTNGANALYLAVSQENEAIASKLLENGVPINQRIYQGDRSALMAAVTVNSVRMLRFLTDRGADIEPTYSSIAAGFGGSLLSFAVQQGAMECARLLLSLEHRPDQRDRTLANAARRGELEFVELMLDLVLPSTENAFLTCVGSSVCPVMLDLMLSRCCAERFPISLFSSKFAFACTLNLSNDMIAVFLAHGLDVMYYSTSDTSSFAVSPLVESLLCGLTVGGNARILELLSDNGVCCVGVNKDGKSPERMLDEMLERELQESARFELKACERVLAATKS